jgi:hypothetical protein
MGLAEAIAEVQMPVYGVVDLDNPLDLTLCSIFLSIGFDMSITLNFISSRYPPCPFDTRMSPLRIRTANRRNRAKDLILEEFLEHCQPLRNPFRWEGTITLEGIPFSGTMWYYAAPLRASGFNFQSEKSFVSGFSYGPSCDEMIELLEGLQVLNGRDDVIREYDRKSAGLNVGSPITKI